MKALRNVDKDNRVGNSPNLTAQRMGREASPATQSYASIICGFEHDGGFAIARDKKECGLMLLASVLVRLVFPGCVCVINARRGVAIRGRVATLQTLLRK